MSLEANLRLGRKGKQGSVDTTQFRNGLKREDFSADLQSIFDKFDNGDHVLTQAEIDELKSKVSQYANRGRNSVFSEREAEKLAKEMELEEGSSSKIFEFLEQIERKAKTISSFEREENGSYTRVYTESGEKIKEKYDSNTHIIERIVGEYKKVFLKEETNSDGSTKLVRTKDIVTDPDKGTVTTTEYAPDGETVLNTVVEEKDNSGNIKRSTTTDYTLSQNNDGTFSSVKATELVVDNNSHTTTTTNFTDDGNAIKDQSVEVLSEDGKTVLSTSQISYNVVKGTNGYTSTKSKEVITNNANHSITTRNYNAAGTGLTTEVIKEGEKTTTRTFESDGKTVKQEVITEGDKTTTIDYQNGKPVSKKVVSGNIEETYEYVNGGERLTQRIKNNSDPQKREVTSVQYSDQGRVETTEVGNSKTTTVLNNANRRLVQQRTVGGKVVQTLQYDGLGNTVGIIVQYGESAQSLAKKFKCNVNDLLKLNGKKPGQNFQPGEAILIPGELDVEDRRLKGRKDQAGVMRDVQQAQERAAREAQRRAEQQAQQQAQRQRRQALDREYRRIGLKNYQHAGERRTAKFKNGTTINVTVIGTMNSRERLLVRTAKGIVYVMAKDGVLLNETYAINTNIYDTSPKMRLANGQQVVVTGNGARDRHGRYVAIDRNGREVVVSGGNRGRNDFSDRTILKNSYVIGSDMNDDFNDRLEACRTDAERNALRRQYQSYSDSNVMRFQTPTGEVWYFDQSTGNAVGMAQKEAAAILSDIGRATKGMGTDEGLLSQAIGGIQDPAVLQRVERHYANVTPQKGNYQTHLDAFLSTEISDSEIYVHGATLVRNRAIVDQGLRDHYLLENMTTYGTNSDNRVAAMGAISTRTDYDNLNTGLEKYNIQRGHNAHFQGQTALQTTLYHQTGGNAAQIDLANTALLTANANASTAFLDNEEIIRIQAEVGALYFEQGNIQNAFRSHNTDIYTAMDGLRNAQGKAVVDVAQDATETDLMLSGYKEYSDEEYAKKVIEYLKLAEKNLNSVSADYMATVGEGHEFDRVFMANIDLQDFEHYAAIAFGLLKNYSVLELVKKELGTEEYTRITNLISHETRGQSGAPRIDFSKVILAGSGESNLSDEDIAKNYEAVSALQEMLASSDREHTMTLGNEGWKLSFVNQLRQNMGWGVTRGDVQDQHILTQSAIHRLELAAKGQLVDANGNPVRFEEAVKQVTGMELAQLQTMTQRYAEHQQYGEMGVDVTVGLATMAIPIPGLGVGKLCAAGGKIYKVAKVIDAARGKYKLVEVALTSLSNGVKIATAQGVLDWSDMMTSDYGYSSERMGQIFDKAVTVGEYAAVGTFIGGGTSIVSSRISNTTGRLVTNAAGYGVDLSTASLITGGDFFNNINIFNQDGTLNTGAILNDVLTTFGYVGGLRVRGKSGNGSTPHTETTPTLTRATSRGTAHAADVVVGPEKARLIREEVGTALARTDITGAELAQLRREVTGLSDQSLRNPLLERIDKRATSLSAAEHQTFSTQRQEHLVEEVNHIFDKYSHIDATDRRILCEYAESLNDINALDNLLAKVNAKEKRYGGVTSEYNTIRERIAARREQIVNHSKTPEQRRQEVTEMLQEKARSGKGLDGKEVKQVQEYIETITSEAELNELADLLKGRRMTNADKAKLNTAIETRRAELNANSHIGEPEPEPVRENAESEPIREDADPIHEHEADGEHIGESEHEPIHEEPEPRPDADAERVGNSEPEGRRVEPESERVAEHEPEARRTDAEGERIDDASVADAGADAASRSKIKKVVDKLPQSLQKAFHQLESAIDSFRTVADYQKLKKAITSTFGSVRGTASEYIVKAKNYLLEKLEVRFQKLHGLNREKVQSILGEKLYGTYCSFEEQIVKLKNSEGFKKLKTSIPKTFGKFPEVVNVLMFKLHQQAKKLGLHIKQGFAEWKAEYHAAQGARAGSQTNRAARRGTQEYIAEQQRLRDLMYPDDYAIYVNEINNLREGQQITGYQRINGNERLRLANYEIDLNSSEIQAKLKELQEGERVVIGRDGEISSPHMTDRVSREHLIVEKTGETYIIKDISANGTTFVSRPDAHSASSGSRASASEEAGQSQGIVPSAERAGSGPIRCSKDIEELFSQETRQRLLNDPSVIDGQSIVLTKNGYSYLVQNIDGEIRIVQKLDHNELCRVAGNEGKEVPRNYILNSLEVRNHFRTLINSGDLFSSFESYKNAINRAHELAYHGESGSRLYYTDSNGVLITPDRMNPGVFHEEGIPSNIRQRETAYVENIAIQYGDPFRVNSSQIQNVQLANIPTESLPCNRISGGSMRHFYPERHSLDTYYREMYRTATEARDLIQNGASQDQILRKLAEHYQYAANARPYRHINNSLFVNELNTFLIEAGMPTMPHGMLDHAAQRLQPDAFQRYFIDEYYKTALE